MHLCTSLSKQLKALTALALFTFLAACSDSEITATAPQRDAVPAQQGAALSHALQTVYDVSCKVCHSHAGSGAPVVGNAQDWAPRIERGLESMVNNALNGIGGMPAMGACFHCSEEDIRSLTRHMAGLP